MLPLAPMKSVHIRGEGIAARCCAHLLGSAGFTAILEPRDRPRLPALMLSHTALALIQDVFEREDLDRNLHHIQKRIVCWGGDANPVTVSHSAVVVSEQALLELLKSAPTREQEPSQPSWTIVTSRPLPNTVEEKPFGSRTAFAVPVDLEAATDASACWIESLERGWLFLIPNAASAGWLLSVGAPPETLLPASRLIRQQIAHVGTPAAQFPAYPRIASPLCEAGWLACGTAAMAFDPLCGDGTANAVRESILASAVIRSIANGGDPASLLRHYDARLTAAFQRHLANCREYYQAGHTGPWWEAELSALDAGLAWSAARTSAHTGFRYRLNGFELQEIGC
jgi:hypothetical protein